MSFLNSATDSKWRNLMLLTDVNNSASVFSRALWWLNSIDLRTKREIMLLVFIANHISGDRSGGKTHLHVSKRGTTWRILYAFKCACCVSLGLQSFGEYIFAVKRLWVKRLLVEMSVNCVKNRWNELFKTPTLNILCLIFETPTLTHAAWSQIYKRDVNIC